MKKSGVRRGVLVYKGPDPAGKMEIPDWVEDMQMPQPIAPILPLPDRGTPWAVARQFQHDGN